MNHLDETKQMKAYCNLNVTSKGIGNIVNIHLENVDTTKDCKEEINRFLHELSELIAMYNERTQHHLVGNNEHQQCRNQDTY
ncbi:MAG: hypothetical protein M9916_01940 [Crocinitomicaceae bacterium]|jgi:hypothetical protein|nr:hypothetical protein [Crocinitomicaceae bacterium]